MALLLACARKVAFYDRLVRAGRWEVPPGKPLFRLAGSTLGLIGFGNIARQVAVRAAAFGMNVLYTDPFVKQGQFNEPGHRDGARHAACASRTSSPCTRRSRRRPAR